MIRYGNYFMHITSFDMRDSSMRVHQANAEPWRVTLIETGEETQIGGRIKRILPHVGDDEAFCVTYGDGVGNVDIRATIDLHNKEKRLATVTATQPPGRFGAIRYEDTRVTGFQEKPVGDGGWINGGFFVLSPQVGRYIEGDRTVWNANRWSNSPPKASSRSTSTRAFGTPWTRCATAAISKTCGRRAARRGRSGKAIPCVS